MRRGPWSEFVSDEISAWTLVITGMHVEPNEYGFGKTPAALWPTPDRAAARDLALKVALTLSDSAGHR